MIYMKKFLIVFFFCILANAVHAQVKGQDYIVNDNNDIVVSKIVENLPLQKNDIYVVVRQYIENAYKETKYKVVMDFPESGIVAGEGQYDNFHEANYFPYSYFLNAPFLLRIDAKDGRARLSVTLSYYTGKRSNINETIDIHDRISDFQPVNTSEDEHRKLYTKAFPLLISKVKKTLDDVASVLASTKVSVMDTDW